MILIDIDGIDNVGKTYLVDFLELSLKKRYSVEKYTSIFSNIYNPNNFSEHEWFVKTPIIEQVSEIAKSYIERYENIKHSSSEVLIFDRGIRTVRISLISRLICKGFPRKRAEKIIHELFTKNISIEPSFSIFICPKSLEEIQETVGDYRTDYLKYQEIFFENMYLKEKQAYEVLSIVAYQNLDQYYDSILKKIKSVSGCENGAILRS